MLIASSGAYAEGGIAFLPGEFVALGVGPVRIGAKAGEILRPA